MYPAILSSYRGRRVETVGGGVEVPRQRRLGVMILCPQGLAMLADAPQPDMYCCLVQSLHNTAGVIASIWYSSASDLHVFIGPPPSFEDEDALQHGQCCTSIHLRQLENHREGQVFLGNFLLSRPLQLPSSSHSDRACTISPRRVLRQPVQAIHIYTCCFGINAVTSRQFNKPSSCMNITF